MVYDAKTMSRFSYIVMSLTTTSASFNVAEMFDESININEIMRAARYGRTIGSFQEMNCEILNGQLRILGDYLNSICEFLASIIRCISITNNIGHPIVHTCTKITFTRNNSFHTYIKYIN